jgi:hypothetical protein
VIASLQDALLLTLSLVLAWVVTQPGLWRWLPRRGPVVVRSEAGGYTSAEGIEMDLRSGAEHFGPRDSRAWEVKRLETMHAPPRGRVVLSIAWRDARTDAECEAEALHIAQVVCHATQTAVAAVEWSDASKAGEPTLHTVIFTADGRGWTGQARQQVVVRIADGVFQSAAAAVPAWDGVPGTGWYLPPLQVPAPVADGGSGPDAA